MPSAADPGTSETPEAPEERLLLQTLAPIVQQTRVLGQQYRYLAAEHGAQRLQDEGPESVRGTGADLDAAVSELLHALRSRRGQVPRPADDAGGVADDGLVARAERLRDLSTRHRRALDAAARAEHALRSSVRQTADQALAVVLAALPAWSPEDRAAWWHALSCTDGRAAVRAMPGLDPATQAGVTLEQLQSVLHLLSGPGLRPGEPLLELLRALHAMPHRDDRLARALWTQALGTIEGREAARDLVAQHGVGVRQLREWGVADDAPGAWMQLWTRARWTSSEAAWRALHRQPLEDVGPRLRVAIHLPLLLRDQDGGAWGAEAPDDQTTPPGPWVDRMLTSLARHAWPADVCRAAWAWAVAAIPERVAALLRAPGSDQLQPSHVPREAAALLLQAVGREDRLAGLQWIARIEAARSAGAEGAAPMPAPSETQPGAPAGSRGGAGTLGGHPRTFRRSGRDGSGAAPRGARRWRPGSGTLRAAGP